MISIPTKYWEELLNHLEELIQIRIGKTQDTLPDFNKQVMLKLFDDFRTEFISDGVGITLSKYEELICLIALLPYLVPGYFDRVVSRMFPEGTELTELGGVKGTHHRGFIPTGETALFLLAGNDLGLRMQAMQYFNPDQPLAKHNILHIESPNEGEPQLSGRIIIARINLIIPKILLDNPEILLEKSPKRPPTSFWVGFSLPFGACFSGNSFLAI